MWFDKNGAMETREPNHRCNHGLEEFQTTNENVLEFGPSTANETLGLFISHDIRNYLASIYCDIEFVSDPDICQTDFLHDRGEEQAKGSESRSPST